MTKEVAPDGAQAFAARVPSDVSRLENIVGWVLLRPVTEAMRESFKHDLFIKDGLDEN